VTTETDTTMNRHEFRGFVQGMRQLIIKKHRSDYELGRFIDTIRGQRLWKRWPRSDRARAGYGSFQELCDKEFGYSTSKANALASNYRRLSLIGLDETCDTFARCMRLGYSKLNTLLRVIGSDEGNLIAWLNDIEGRNLSELQLRARIQEARRAAAAEATGTGEDNTTIDPTAEATYVPYMVRFADQAGLEAFTQVIDIIRNRYDTTIGMGQCITMMAVQYLASVPRDEEGGAPVEIENLLRMIEAGWGLRLKVDVGAARPRGNGGGARNRVRGRHRRVQG
jgi:hypothetical protein